MKTLRVKRLHEEAIIPTRTHSTDAGLDLYACNEMLIQPFTTVKISTNLAVDVSPGYVGLVRDRSSVSLKGLKVNAGVVDAGYRGVLQIVLVNVGKEERYINKGDKIAQLLIVPIATPLVEEVMEFTDETDRGAKGFGSSGA